MKKPLPTAINPSFAHMLTAFGCFCVGSLSISLLNWSPIRPEIRQSVAEENLANFLKTKPNTVSGTCVSSDSEPKDGYVSCDFTTQVSDTTTEIQVALCNYNTGWLANKGCKIPVLDNQLRRN